MAHIAHRCQQWYEFMELFSEADVAVDVSMSIETMPIAIFSRLREEKRMSPENVPGRPKICGDRHLGFDSGRFVRAPGQ
jgi:hypothetical protein